MNIIRLTCCVISHTDLTINGFQKKYEVKILNDLFSHIIFLIVQYPFFKS